MEVQGVLELVKSYTVLVNNSDVNALLKSVQQDLTTKVVKHADSKKTVTDATKKLNTSDARGMILGFLNQVMYASFAKTFIHEPFSLIF